MKNTDGIEWWAGIGGEPVGPLSAADVRARWEAGELTPATLVWRAGFPEWKPAGDVPELAAPKAAAASEGGAWKPSAGSALAALAGAELAALQRPERKAPATSGSARLDAFTGAAAAASSPPAATPTAPAANLAASGAPPPAAMKARRRAVVTSAAGTFAMGAALVVALLVVFRTAGGNGEANAMPAPRAESAASPASAAPGPAVHPSASPAEPAATGDADSSAMARGAVQTSEPVRASDPPAASPAASQSEPPQAEANATAAKSERPVTAPPPQRRAIQNARAERAAKGRAAAVEARRTPPAPAPQRKETRVAMAVPKKAAAAADSNDPLDSLPPPAPSPSSAASSARDPLANLVTDEDLDRELGGDAAAPSRAAPPAPAPAASSTPRAEPRPAASAVYVPPGPGGGAAESVTAAQINEAVKGRISALRGCIEEQRSADPATKGTLKLRWVIAGDGSVRDVRNLTSEFEGKPIARCIGGVVQDIHFPPSRTSGQEVVFPFKF